jgi:hypothetical protein
VPGAAGLSRAGTARGSGPAPRAASLGRAGSGPAPAVAPARQGSLLALYVTEPIITLVAGLLKARGAGGGRAGLGRGSPSSMRPCGGRPPAADLRLFLPPPRFGPQGDHTVAQALSHGDFGLGTLDQLDGEVAGLGGGGRGCSPGAAPQPAAAPH